MIILTQGEAEKMKLYPPSSPFPCCSFFLILFLHYTKRQSKNKMKISIVWIFLILVSIASALDDSRDVIMLGSDNNDAEISLLKSSDDDDDDKGPKVRKSSYKTKAANAKDCVKGGSSYGTKTCLFYDLTGVLFPLMSEYYSTNCVTKATPTIPPVLTVGQQRKYKKEKIKENKENNEKRKLSKEADDKTKIVGNGYKVYDISVVSKDTDMYTSFDKLKVITIDSIVAKGNIYRVNFAIYKNRSNKILSFTSTLIYQFQWKKSEYLDTEYLNNPHLVVSRGWRMKSLSLFGVTSSKEEICTKIKDQKKIGASFIEEKSQSRVKWIDEHNRSNNSWKAHHYNYGTRTLGFIPPTEEFLQRTNNDSKIVQLLATQQRVTDVSFDWNDSNKTCESTIVADQGTCGSCFAVSLRRG